MRLSGRSAATSIFLRRTMPMSITASRASAIEADVGRREAGLLELLHELRGRASSPSIQPRNCQIASEVLDVVDQRRSGERDQQRVAAGPARGCASASASTFFERCDVQVLDEVRLVDDHALEAERAEPRQVPVEHLVVDDDDVGEGVDVLAVAVDDRGATLRRPALDLARPVHLDDVGHDGEQRVGVGDGCREHATAPSCRGPARRRAGRCGVPRAPLSTKRAWWGISSRPLGERRSNSGAGGQVHRWRPRRRRRTRTP